jgi:hypothetical protein
MGGACTTHETRNVHKFWFESLIRRDQSEDQDIDGKTILKLISKKRGGRIRSGLVWFRIDTRSGLL